MFDKTMVRGLMAAALAISASIAWAGDITYYIVDYPAYETDTQTGLKDMISGFITTDGITSRPLTASDIVGGSYTFTSIYGSVTAPIAPGEVEVEGVTATDTELLLPSGADLTLEP